MIISIQSLVENWPQKIDNKVIFQPLVDFCKGSIWEHPKIFSVCGLEHHGVENIENPHIGELPLFFGYPSCFRACYYQRIRFCIR